MAAARIERRLAAILAADVVGYSRLVERDEAATLAAIKTLRLDVIDPLLAEHHGRIVKLMGDGAIVEFGSVVDAVVCAVAVQRGVAARQEGVAAARCIVFRIGVNLGDLVSGPSTIDIGEMSWIASPSPPFQNGTLSKTTAQTVASGTDNVANPSTGTLTFRLTNSWTYDAGIYTQTLVFTLSTP